VSRQYATAVAHAEVTSVSCEQSSVPVAGVQAQPGDWLALATWQKPDVYGVNPVDCLSTSLRHVLP
jgi:hypothetical protein